MPFDLNWTILISGAFNTAVNGMVLLLVTRYFGRTLDHVEKNGRVNHASTNEKTSGKQQISGV
jgi:hypothetical protein